MNTLKNLIYLAMGFWIVSCTTQESKEQPAQSTTAEPSIDLAAEEAAVRAVMRAYKDALERLDVSGTDTLFAADSEILEQGKVEGTYQDYIAHHIGPELGHFESFTFGDYDISITIGMPYAFTTETYYYSIVLKDDNSKIERKGAATSVLKKNDDGSWKIIKTHGSSRAKK